MATGYDVSALGAYTKDNPDKSKWLYKQIMTGDSASKFKMQTGIKTSERIHLIESNPVIQAQACGFTASANTVFTDRTLTVASMAVYMDWCEKDLEAKYTQLAMKAGSELDSLTFETQIVDEIMMKLQYKRERGIWSGNTLSTDQDLIHFDGLRKLIAAASIGATITPVAWTVANSRTAVQNFVSGLTNDMLIQPSGKIFMGTSECRDYRLKLGIDNLYHQTGKEAVLYAENTDIEIVPTVGLSGTKEIYFMPTDYTFIGTDLESEQDTFDLSYAREARKIRFICEYKMGVNFAFPSLIAKMINT